MWTTSEARWWTSANEGLVQEADSQRRVEAGGVNKLIAHKPGTSRPKGPLKLYQRLGLRRITASSFRMNFRWHLTTGLQAVREGIKVQDVCILPIYGFRIVRMTFHY